MSGKDLLVAEQNRLQDEVYRVKGFVPVLGGTLYVDLASRRLGTQDLVPPSYSSDSLSPAEPGRLVFIFPPEAKELVDGVIARLASEPPAVPLPAEVLTKTNTSV